MTRNFIDPSRLFATSVALSASLVAPSVFACGGFFCSRSAPVVQAAERIIFAQDGNQVTQIVEVMYEGPSENFSWILPVPGIPEPGVSSKEVFNLLDGATAPQYQLRRDYSCIQNDYAGDGDLASVETASGDPSSAPPPVTVLDAGSVGPFDYETISITSDDDPAAVAVAWLEDNGYDVTDETGDVLGPYLANGLNLIAFRLQKGQSTGAIRPISLEYEAPKAAIPIKPTSVAANDDMPVLVWVLGKDRAVPTNYRGLELNELLIDWFRPMATYNDVVTAAANEAGGQGFVTELVTDASNFVQVVMPSENDIANIFNRGGSFEDQIQTIVARLGSWDGFLEAAAAHIELREGVTIDEFVGSPYAYFYPGDYGVGFADNLGFGGAKTIEEGIDADDPIYRTDLEAFESALLETVIGPLLDAGELLEKHDKLTRLYTTMSADEMTKDPTFEFNPDLEDVSNVHTAIQTMDDKENCSGAGEWTITLEDGTKVYGEGNVWPHSLGDTDLSANARILQFSTSGSPKVVEDQVEVIVAEHKETDAGTPPQPTEPKGRGGGCTLSPAGTQTPLSWLAALGFAGAFSVRRRRRA